MVDGVGQKKPNLEITFNLMYNTLIKTMGSILQNYDKYIKLKGSLEELERRFEPGDASLIKQLIEVQDYKTKTLEAFKQGSVSINAISSLAARELVKKSSTLSAEEKQKLSGLYVDADQELVKRAILANQLPNFDVTFDLSDIEKAQSIIKDSEDQKYSAAKEGIGGR